MGSRLFFGEIEVKHELGARPQMAYLLGYTILMPKPDLYKFELPITGMFRADLVIGNDRLRKFVLVELEDAEPDSLFTGRSKSYRQWARRLEHGFGQLIDWAWARTHSRGSPTFESAFRGVVNDDAT